MIKEVMQIRSRIIRHSCWSPTKLIKQLRKTILKTVRQPQSPVLVYYLSYWPLPLAQAIQTHCLNQFSFLSLNYKLKDIDQLCYDKKSKDYRSPWRLQMHTFWCNNKRWRILAPNRTKLIASMVDTQDNISWALLKLFQLWTCFAAALFALLGNLDGQCM